MKLDPAKLTIGKRYHVEVEKDGLYMTFTGTLRQHGHEMGAEGYAARVWFGFTNGIRLEALLRETGLTADGRLVVTQNERKLTAM